MSLFVRPQELVLTFLLVAGIALAAAFGWSLRSVAALVTAAALFGLVQLRLSRTGLSLWRGLCLIAARTPTQSAWIDLLILAPSLLLITVYAVGITLVGLPLRPAWTRSAWLLVLRAKSAQRLARVKTGRPAPGRGTHQTDPEQHPRPGSDSDAPQVPDETAGQRWALSPGAPSKVLAADSSRHRDYRQRPEPLTLGGC